MTKYIVYYLEALKSKMVKLCNEKSCDADKWEGLRNVNRFSRITTGKRCVIMVVIFNDSLLRKVNSIHAKVQTGL